MIKESQIEKLLTSFRDGATVVEACALSGVSRVWFYQNMKKEDFAIRVNQSIAMSYAQAIKCLRDAATKDWRAALAFLERRFPEEWGIEKTKSVKGRIPPHVTIEIVKERKTTHSDKKIHFNIPAAQPT